MGPRIKSEGDGGGAVATALPNTNASTSGFALELSNLVCRHEAFEVSAELLV